jgi:hypothetical protein
MPKSVWIIEHIFVWDQWIVPDWSIPDIIIWDRKGIYSLLAVSLPTDKNVLCEEVAKIINTRIYWLYVCHAEVRKVPTTIGATGSLSRTLAQYLDDWKLQHRTAESGQSGNSTPIEEDDNEAHESVSVFSMKLLSCCPRLLLEMNASPLLSRSRTNGPLQPCHNLLYTFLFFIDLSTALPSYRPQSKTFLSTLLPDFHHVSSVYFSSLKFYL